MKTLILPALLILFSISVLHAAEIPVQPTDPTASNSQDLQANLPHAQMKTPATQEVKDAVTHPVEKYAKHPVTQKTMRIYQEPFMPLSLRSR